MLIVEVPDKLPYRHVYKVSYDISYSAKRLTKSSSSGAETLETRLLGLGQQLLTALGWRDTSFEFDTPAAKLAQSYHLKVQVPESMEISKAVLVAGSPDQRAAIVDADLASHQPHGRQEQGGERYHLDVAVGGGSTVDLQVVEVGPHESARARVDLKAGRSGWLGSACLAGLLAFAAALLVSGRLGAFHPWFGRPASRLDLAELTLLATTLAGLSALLATMLAGPSEHPMASELLYRLQPLSSLAMLAPFVAAAVLIFAPNPIQGPLVWAFPILTILSGFLAAVLVIAWLGRRRRTRPTESPWHRDVPEEAWRRLEHSQRPWPRLLRLLPLAAGRLANDSPISYQEALDWYKFDRPAVETEIRRDQPPVHMSPQSEAAELIKRFDEGGCRRGLTESRPEAPTNSPSTRA